MNITITPAPLRGTIRAIPSKSMAHRLLILSAFGDRPAELLCAETNRDIEATAQCLQALGAEIQRTEAGYSVVPVREIPQKTDLYCCESGSTLRFLLPVVGALGVEAAIHMAGRLAARPLSPLWEEMERMGCRLSRSDENTILCHGKLKPGTYTIAGNVSSQFISGLLFAFRLMDGACDLEITGTLESAPYVALTKAAMELFPEGHSPERIAVEGDWSNAAFFLAAGALGNPVTVENLNPHSLQGDRAVTHWLDRLKEHTIIPAGDIPDLVPILAIVAACGKGAVFTNIRRLRMKESDRVASTIAMVKALGGEAWATEDTLTVSGTGLIGGTVDSCNDHRIAMSAAIAATVCSQPVTILGAQSVNKSYPGFWDVYTQAGGLYEQYLR